MELLLILGVLAVAILLAAAVIFFLQHRRNGTIRAVVTPRRHDREGEGSDRLTASE